MYRLAALLVALVACSSGFETGPATLSGIMPTIMSAGANSFTSADGSGNTVLGWKLEFFSNGSGYDCQSTDANELADLVIYTNQPPSGSMKATISVGDISIVPDNPPTALGGVVAHLAVDGIHQINGDLDLTDVHINTSSNAIDRFVGTVTAGGTDDTGVAVALDGMFTAPVCE